MESEIVKLRCFKNGETLLKSLCQKLYKIVNVILRSAIVALSEILFVIFKSSFFIPRVLSIWCLHLGLCVFFFSSWWPLCSHLDARVSFHTLHLPPCPFCPSDDLTHIWLVPSKCYGCSALIIHTGKTSSPNADTATAFCLFLQF